MTEVNPYARVDINKVIVVDMEAVRDQCEDEDEGVQCVCDESVVVWGGDLDNVCKRFGVTGGISEQLPA